MIDFVFAVVDAGWSLIFLALGLVLLGVGLLIFGYPFWQRFRWLRVKARIVELRTQRVETNHTPTEKSPPKAMFLLLIVPLIFMGIGGYFAFDYARLKLTGVQVPAQVVRMESSADSEGSSSYWPVVAFRDRMGRDVEMKHSFGSSGGEKEFKAGDQVIVFYEEGRPDHFIIDRFWFNMLMPIILFGFGSVFILIVYASVFMRGKSRAHYTYLPVFEFITPEGRMVKAQEENARFSLTHNLPGQDAYIYLNPKKPDQPARPTYSIGLFGLILVLPGFLIVSSTLKGMEWGWPLVVAFVGGFAFIVSKVMRRFAVDDVLARWRDLRSHFKFQIRKDSAARAGLRGQIMEMDAILKEQRTQDSQMVCWTPFYVLLMGGVLWGGWHVYNKQAQFEKVALRAEAEVVRLISSSDSDGTVYHPLYRFISADGETIEFKDNVGSNPPSARKGDRAQVLYDRAYPRAAIVDRGLMNRLPGGIMLLLGGWGLFATVRGFWRAYPRFSRNR